MSQSIKQKKQQRYRMLEALYRWSDANTAKWVDMRQLCQKEGLSFDGAAYDYLMAEGLIAQHGAGYACRIQHKGIKAMEEAWERPREATDYFPAVNDIEPENGHE